MSRDLPTGELVQTQLAEAHLITAPHTLAHWERALYLPGPTFDRKNREAWERDGSRSLWQRAVAEVDARLAAYQPVVTDPLLDAELRRLVRAGMTAGGSLPATPPSGEGIPAPAQRPQRVRIRDRNRVRLLATAIKEGG